MSEDLKVVYQDLAAAAKAFDKHGEDFAQIAPDSGPPVPQVTEASLKAVLPQVLQAVGLMHDALASCMETHASKLRAAKKIHLDAEDSNRQQIDGLLNAMASPDSIKE